MTSCFDISMAEYNTLQSLYMSTSGDSWFWNVSVISTVWHFPSPLSAPCSNSWQGLLCTTNPEPCLDHDSACCSIYSIDLSNYNLYGALPSLGNLTGLSLLSLAFNSITGTIPNQWPSSLISLSLFSNSISGPIPSQLFSCYSLRNMSLDYNSLSGSIPSEIGQVKDIALFTVFANVMTGTIPTQLSLLSQLQSLLLGECFFSGRLSFLEGSFPYLMYFDVYFSFFEGSIPSNIGQFAALEQAAFGGNYLTGPIPTQLCLLSNLLQIDFSVNSFSGTIPSALGSQLISFFIYQNFITGSLPSNLLNMTRLEQWSSYSNLLTGSLPTDAFNRSSIETVDLSTNLLTGSLPDSIFSSTGLEVFGVNSNHMTGTIPKISGSLISIELFDLGANSITGTIPASLTQCSDLFLLDLEENQLTGTIPTGLGQLSAMEVLYLYDNSLSGTIPPQLGSLLSVQQMDLNSNNLEGSIPSQLQFLKNLTQFNLNNNYFTGSVPSQLVDCSALQYFDVSVNYLSSTVPSLLSKLPYLQCALLGDNFLSGLLPLNLTHLNLLQDLNFSKNLLSGPISNLIPPSSPASSHISNSTFTNLRVIDLSQNALSGSLPDSLFSSSLLEVVSLYSNCFSGTLPLSLCRCDYVTTLIFDALSSATSCDVWIPPGLQSVVRGKLPSRYMTGSIPQCVWSLPNLTTLHISGNGFSGSLHELPPTSILTDLSASSNNIVGPIPMSMQTRGSFTQLDLSNNRLDGTLSSSFQVNQPSIALQLSVNRLSGNIPSSLHALEDISILDGNMFQCTAGQKPIHDKNSQSYVCGSSNLNYSLIAWLSSLLLCIATYLGFQKTKFTLYFPDFNLRSRKILAVETSKFVNIIRYSSLLCINFTTASLLVCLPIYMLMKLVPSWAAAISTHSEQYAWVTTFAFVHGATPTAIIIMFITCCFVLSLRHARPSYHTLTPTGRRYEVSDICRITILVSVHVVVVIIVNVLYVYALLHGLPPVSLLCVQISISVFKLVWSKMTVELGLKYLPHVNSTTALVLSTFLVMFTFLAGPFLATFFTDSSCFRNVLIPEQAIASSFPVQQFLCGLSCLNTNDCYLYCEFDPTDIKYTLTNVIPGWLYSYQCSSALLIDYTPVLAISFTISGLLSPVFRSLVLDGPLASSNRQLPVWLQVHPILHRTGTDDSINRHSLIKTVPVLSNLIRNLSILLTFGLACPLLAVLIAVDSYNTAYSWISAIDAIIINSEKSLESNDSATYLEAVLTHSILGYSPSVTIALVGCSVFWSLFIFDMIGDLYGSKSGALALGVFCICLWLLIGIYSSIMYRSSLVMEKSGDTSSATVVEISIEKSPFELNQDFVEL